MNIVNKDLFNSAVHVLLCLFLDSFTQRHRGRLVPHAEWNRDARAVAIVFEMGLPFYLFWLRISKDYCYLIKSAKIRIENDILKFFCSLFHGDATTTRMLQQNVNITKTHC